jgi:hypothetical protein
VGLSKNFSFSTHGENSWTSLEVEEKDFTYLFLLFTKG